MVQPNKITLAEARVNAVAIRRLWQMGRDCQAHLDKLKQQSFAYGNKAKIFEQEAARLGTNVDTVSKSRRLGEEYTDVDIKVICKLIVKHRSTFAAANMLIILRVEDRDQRDQMMKKAIRESWSFSHLERMIQGLHGVRRRARGGRKPQIPSDRAARLVALDATVEKMCRWCEAALPQLPASLRPRVERAIKAARNVQGAVVQRLQRGK